MTPQHVTAPPSRLDLWLAATLGMDPRVGHLLARSGVERQAVAEVSRAAVAAGISQRCLTTPAQIVAFFGRPAAVRTDRLVYDLVLWPAHRFIWAISRWGDAGPVGLRLRETLPIAPLRVGAAVDYVRAQFRPWHHTEHEVRCALGPADRTIGDNASSRWVYLAPARRVCLEFKFGWALLRDISARLAPTDLPARGSPLGVSRRPVGR